MGETLKLVGEWGEHPKFGRQFRVSACEQTLPADTNAIFRYLASGAIKGIGPSTAGALIEKFGSDTLRIMEEEPEKLAKVKGISPAKNHSLITYPEAHIMPKRPLS